MATAPLSELHAMLAKIGRERTARRVNAVINHPEVQPFVKGLAKLPLDLSPAVLNPNNVLLMGQHGGVFFHQHQPGIYEAHTQVVPEGRGAWTVAMVKAALHWMFTRSDAVEILTRCPKGNFAARALAKAIGGKMLFTNPRGWVMDDVVISADIFALTIQDWLKTAPGLEERGHWFHDRLREQFDELGATEPIHDDDLVHDRYVGAACEMFLNGQPQKGIVFYNRWAALADYEKIDLVSLDPLAVDIRTAIVVVRGNDFYVATTN